MSPSILLLQPVGQALGLFHCIQSFEHLEKKLQKLSLCTVSTAVRTPHCQLELKILKCSQFFRGNKNM
jgi:hypothetical protein